MDFPLTRGELEAIAGALSLLNREMCRKAGLSAAPSDPLPPRIAQVSALLHRARQALEQGKAPRRRTKAWNNRLFFVLSRKKPCLSSAFMIQYIPVKMLI